MLGVFLAWGVGGIGTAPHPQLPSARDIHKAAQPDPLSASRETLLLLFLLLSETYVILTAALALVGARGTGGGIAGRS